MKKTYSLGTSVRSLSSAQRKVCRLLSAFAVAALAFAPSAKAATKYWDKNANGTWDTSTANWSTSAGGGSDTTFATLDDAIFGSTTVTAASLTITTTTLSANR